jgi:hypothetical protein
VHQRKEIGQTDKGKVPERIQERFLRSRQPGGESRNLTERFSERSAGIPIVGGEGFPPLFPGTSPTFRVSGHNQLTYTRNLK